MENKVIDPAREELERLIEQSGTQKAAAEELEITPAYLSDILQGKRNLSEEVLERLGFARVTVHVKRERIPLLIKQVNKVLKEAS